MKPSLRSELEGEPYGAPQVEAGVRLNTNECPYPLPQGFVRDLQEALAALDLNRYPDREATALRESLGTYVGRDPSTVWVANGSNEIIQHLCLAYGGPGRRALVFDPTYALHTFIPGIAGMEVVREPLTERFALPADAAEASERHHAAIVFVCSPNNPTGNAQPIEMVEAICEATDGLVIADEAYGEFGGTSAKPLLDRFPNLVIVKTFSKAFALAAARIGYALGDAALLAALERVRLPYHLSALSQAAGVTALRHADEALAILDRVRAERDRMADGLRDLEEVEVFPSDANFLLFRTVAPAEELWQALLERDVLVRDVSSAPRLERCLRVTAGTPEETDAFLTALPLALKEAA